MSLQDYINKYGNFISNDYELILSWIDFNHNEDKMIELLNNLAIKQVQEKKKNDFRNKEWSYYAFCNLVNIKTFDENTPDNIILNSIRLAYMGLDDCNFKKAVDEICNNTKLDIEIIKNLHFEIYNKYKNLENMSKIYKDGDRDE